MQEQKVFASIVSKIEVVGFHKLNKQDIEDFEVVFKSVEIIPLSNSIAKRAIELRQARSISLGDSIIAATAIEYDKTLVTRNVKDFSSISGLHIFNPIDE
jgi:predicted nucleic acid-binding protein